MIPAKLIGSIAHLPKSHQPDACQIGVGEPLKQPQFCIYSRQGRIVMIVDQRLEIQILLAAPFGDSF